MSNKLRLLCILYLLTLNIVRPSFALDTEPPSSQTTQEEIITNEFQINDIKVDEIADNSQQARMQAIKKAQKNAFAELLKRLSADISNEKFSDDEISQLVSALQVKDEKITKNRYIATMDITFNQEYSQFYIGEKILNRKSEKKLKILLIPLYNENGFLKLWQSGNEWMNFWNKLNFRSMVHIELPNGDIDDLTLLNLENIHNISNENFTKLLQHYNVDRIVIAQLITNYQTISEDAEFSVTLQQLDSPENQTIIDKITSTKSAPKEDTMNYLAQKIIGNLEANWVAFNQANIKQQTNKQDFLVAIKSLKEWLHTESKIQSLEFLKNYQLNSLSTRYAHITLEFKEKPIKLIETMKGLGFKINSFNDKVIIQSL
jgi:hypothetical protein